MFKKYARAITTVAASAIVLAIIPWHSIAVNGSQTYIIDVVDGKLKEAKQELANVGLFAETEITHVADVLIVDLNPNQVNTLSYKDSIEAVYSDQPVNLSNTQTSPDWGLDRLDSGEDELDGQFSYPDNAGQGVRVYVVDTGVRADHTDFGGRVVEGYDAYEEGKSNTDCNGHGTHIASVAAGEKYGVAKNATIVPVRVMDCDGVGYYSEVIKGLDWIAKTHPSELDGVVNISLGGYAYSLIDDAIVNLYSRGLLSVVAAGNFNDNACNYSPARTPAAITIGSIDKDLGRSAFSNYGDCVDAYAPGFYVRAADSNSLSGSVQKSGTSQSAPYASGVLATILSINPGLSPSLATNQLKSLFIDNAVSDTNSSYDYLLQSVTSTTELPPAPPEEPEEPESTPKEPEVEPEQPEPTPEEPIKEEPESAQPELDVEQPAVVPYVSVSEASSDSVSISWGYVSNASHYQIMVGFSGEEMTRHSKRVSNTSSYELKGLLPAKNYWLQIVAYDNSNYGLPTDRIEFSTEGAAPGSPREADVFRNILSWREPANKGGASTIVYVVQQRTNGVWLDVASTYETTYAVPYPNEGTDLYRVLATNEYGKGESTGTLYVRPKAPQVTEPVEQEPVVEGITIAQKQVGSAFVILGWAAVDGATTYVIEKSEDNGNDWDVAASTEKTEALTTAWLNRPYLFKVVAQMSNGSTVEIGSAEYFGE